MRIVNRCTFLSLPSGTVFSKYQSMCLFGNLSIKGDAVGENDFWFQDLTGPVDADSSDVLEDVMTLAETLGESIPLSFDFEERDGLFDGGQMFAVWDVGDVRALIARLTKSISTESADKK